jgi:integrase
MLSDSKVKYAQGTEKRYRIADADGLYVEVMPTGKKYWLFRYTQGGKRHWLTLGEYPLVGLKEARELRDKARRDLFDGAPVGGTHEEVHKEKTFEEVALEWSSKLEQRLTSEKEKQTSRGRIKNHVLPYIGDMPITSIKPTDILPIIRRIEANGTLEVMHRVYQNIGRIFRYGVASGYCERDPSSDIKDALLPANHKNFAAITDEREVGAFLRAIDEYPGIVVRYALMLSALTFCRPGEIRHCEWCEIDFTNKEWRIGSVKMKMRRDHIVPLSTQSLAVLERMMEISGNGQYVFPSVRTPDGSRPMSDIAVLAAIRRMGYEKDEMTAHGFRSMASTILHDHNWPGEVIEVQLAHQEQNKVKAAYNRAQYLDKRREMMQWWADHLDELKKGSKT